MTGSINQACAEAGTSQHTKTLLAQAEMTDVIMAPAADMFELGVRLQVLKRGTLFAMRALKLFDLYKNCDSIEEIPPVERERLERQVFGRDLDSVWEDCVSFFGQRDPDQIRRAASNPKRKMALIFRWYCGFGLPLGYLGGKRPRDGLPNLVWSLDGCLQRLGKGHLPGRAGGATRSRCSPAYHDRCLVLIPNSGSQDPGIEDPGPLCSVSPTLVG